MHAEDSSIICDTPTAEDVSSTMLKRTEVSMTKSVLFFGQPVPPYLSELMFIGKKEALISVSSPTWRR